MKKQKEENADSEEAQPVEPCETADQDGEPVRPADEDGMKKMRNDLFANMSR